MAADFFSCEASRQKYVSEGANLNFTNCGKWLKWGQRRQGETTLIHPLVAPPVNWLPSVCVDVFSCEASRGKRCFWGGKLNSKIAENGWSGGRGDYPYSPLGATTGKLSDFRVYKLIFLRTKRSPVHSGFLLWNLTIQF